jgi:hypothetical protein
MDGWWATECLTTDGGPLGSLGTYSLLCFIQVETRHGHLAGGTAPPNEAWRMPRARTLTMAEWGLLQPGQSLLHDRATTCCAAFQQRRDDAGVKRVPLPPQAPWLPACAERGRQAVQTAVRSRMMLCGERSLRHVLSEYVAPHHAERPHQGTGNLILLPSAQAASASDAPVERRERRGGLLNSYQRKAACIF